jgi:hypothetical protein
MSLYRAKLLRDLRGDDEFTDVTEITNLVGGIKLPGTAQVANPYRFAGKAGGNCCLTESHLDTKANYDIIAVEHSEVAG